MTEVKCPACSHVNDDAARFCGSCGALLDVGSRVHHLVGQMIGDRYHIKRIIAEGGMGIVYAAEQKMGTHLREVAVKTLLPELTRDQTTVSRFYRECGTVAQLDHPNTIRFFDFGEAPDGSLYIAMEYVRGEPLSGIIEHSGPLAVDRVLHIVGQICGALHEAHELGIVHRDLKPDNILLTERAGDPDFVKLLDFGIAARVNAGTSYETKLTQQGMVLGTPPYMSPEQFSGGEIDRRSDLYSLGVIVYEMVQGRLPFEADTPWQWAHQHMAVVPPPLGASVPAHVRLGIDRALAKSPDQRPATAVEFLGYLTGRVHVDRIATAPDEVESPDAHTTPMLAVRAQDPVAGTTQPAPAAMPMAPGVPGPLPAPTARRPGRIWKLVAASAAMLGAGGALAAGFWWQSSQASLTSGQPPPQSSSTALPPVVELRPLASAPTSDIPAVQTPVVPSRANSSPQAPKAPSPPSAPTVPATGGAAPTGPLLPPLTLPSGWPSIQIPGLPLPGTSATAEPTPSASTTPSAQPSGQPSASAERACLQARAAAGVGQIEQAVIHYKACEQDGASARQLAATRRAISSGAAAEVRRRAFNGDCDGARSAVSAAASIGAGNAAQAELDKHC
jgi:serine/threonine protein kinase